MWELVPSPSAALPGSRSVFRKKSLYEVEVHFDLRGGIPVLPLEW